MTDSDFDPHLDGPGKMARVMICEDGDARQVEMQWGFEPIQHGGRPLSLLRAERWEVARPCLVLANDFGLKADRNTKYRASLITSEAFFCLGAMWRPATQRWPASFAVLTVEAYPDLAPYKERHVAVIRPEHWFDWLMKTRPSADILTPFPAGSFKVTSTSRGKALADLFG